MFYSGWMPVADIKLNVRRHDLQMMRYLLTLSQPPTWNLTINDTEPVFYYCGAPGSCIDWGMVGVINANASTSISTQIALARQADFQLLPGEPFPSEDQQASMASLARTATTATLTVTATPASKSGQSDNLGLGGDDNNQKHTGNSSGLSNGAVAGIAVGTGIVGVGAAALFFMMYRIRALKKQLDSQQHGGSLSRRSSWYSVGSRQAGGVPPYRDRSHYALKSAAIDGLASDQSQSPQPTPPQAEAQQFMPFIPTENARPAQ